jgi:hypothetical protein
VIRSFELGWVIIIATLPAVGAGAIVGHHRLPPGLRHVLAERTGQKVGRAAGRERDHHADLPVGPAALAARRQRRCKRAGGDGLHEGAPSHCRK